MGNKIVPFVGLFLMVFFLGGIVPGFSRVMDHDPSGFQGILWGKSLVTHHELESVDSEDHIHIYQPKESVAQFGGIPVESLRYITINDQFAKVRIHYRGEKTHQSIFHYLESHYGKIHLQPGAMMRGLNQQYTWRGPKTEITLLYRGLGERGFLTVESRTLAPRFLDSIRSNSY